RPFDQSSATAFPVRRRPRTIPTSTSENTIADGASREVLRKTLTDEIRARALDLGFDAFGVTRPDAIELAGTRLQTFLDAGYHGDMTWMKTTAHRRRDPRALMEYV